ncbi:MAG: hypothetical protein SFX73_28805 [Kofleriaceae bacterium]|nr:hypothetical protein [Kofleriaceae bacterium]
MRPSAPAVKPSAPASASRGGMELTDIVPKFRTDLSLTRTENGYRVDDPVDGASYMLNEYEISLARMLDGQRPVFEVLANAERIGIPINAQSLETFIATLQSSGFLRPPESLDDALDNAMSQTWPARGQWDKSVRTLYQSGLRLLRMGKPDEAASYFEAVLAEDPGNVEAKDLLEIVRQRIAAPQMGAPQMGIPQMGAPQMMPVMQQAPVQYQQQQPAYIAGVPTGSQVIPMPGHPLGAFVVMAPPAPAPRRTHPLVYALIAVAIAGGIVVGFVVTRGTDRQEPPAGPATGTQGVVTANRVEDAAVVAPPVVVDAAVAPLAVDAAVADVLDAAVADVLDAAPVVEDATVAVAVVPDAAAGTEAGSGSETPEKPAPKQPKPTPKLPPERVSAPSDGEIRALLRGTRKVRKGERLFEILGDSARLKAAKKKVDELATLAKTDAVYADFLIDAKAELAQASKPAAVVTAPRAGTATPKVKTGATVTRGQLLVEIK